MKIQMNHSSSNLTKFFFLLSALISSGKVFAQASEWSIVQFSGQMHATATMCGDYGQAQLQDMKTKQKNQYIELGMSATKFESDFQQGFQKEKVRLGQLSAAEKAKECQKLKSMSKM